MKQTGDLSAQLARQEQILSQAKGIMNNFFESLKKADISVSKIGVLRSNQTREPKVVAKDDVFRQFMFANAKNKDIDHIVAEKRHW